MDEEFEEYQLHKSNMCNKHCHYCDDDEEYYRQRYLNAQKLYNKLYSYSKDDEI